MSSHKLGARLGGHGIVEPCMVENVYKRLTPLRLDDPDAVLYAPGDYPHLGRLSTIPVALIEFSALGGVFPLLWHEGLHGHEPVALTGVVPGHGVLLTLPAAQEKPLLFLAYPLAAPQHDGSSDKVALGLDEAPTRFGASSEPIFVSSGTFGRRAQQAAQALQVFLADRSRTLAVSASLARSGAFVAWQNRLSFADEQIELSGLLAIESDYESTQHYRELLMTHGPLFALVIECHRISLKQFQTLASMTLASEGAVA
jgi:hypothetical protein